MKTTIDDFIVDALFVEQVSGSSVLKEIAHYDRSCKGAPNRTYEFLVNTVRRYLDCQKHLRNRRAMAHALGGAASTVAPAAPGEEEEDGQ